MKLTSILTIIALSLAIASCTSDEEILTTINPDGSCSRSFTRNVDSSFLAGDTAKSNPFPVDIDSNWKITSFDSTTGIHADWPLKEVKTISAPGKVNKFTTTIRRDFKSVEDMAENFRLKKSHEWSGLKPRYSLDKKFRWFYTYYTYKEIYPKIKTFDKIPFSKYMTKDEAEFWFTGKPDLLTGMNGLEIREYIGNLEDKYNLWLAKNIWLVEYEELMKHYDSLPVKPVSKQRLEYAKDSVFDKYYSAADANKQDVDMNKSLNDYFGTTGFSPLWEKENGPMAKFENEGYNLEFIDLFNKSFNYKLILPGKSISSNNAITAGDTLTWKLDAYRMVYSDYELTAQSRKTNTWAFVVSAVILLVAAGSFFIKFKR